MELTFYFILLLEKFKKIIISKKKIGGKRGPKPR